MIERFVRGVAFGSVIGAALVGWLIARRRPATKA
jgi:hypothetical protein